MTTHRILVTGSRDWTDGRAIALAITNVMFANGWTPRDTVVVHGACPTGADQIAEEVAGALGIVTDPHPADWSKGKGAGPDRNQEMVDLGANVCLAFATQCRRPDCTKPYPHGTHGTVDAARRAVEAGIPIVPDYRLDDAAVTR